jgi:1-acyl-sn-glycerol-3-phosphate acyltransferase
MKWLYQLYIYYIYLVIGCTFFIFMPILWILCSWKSTYYAAHVIRTWWSKLVLFICGCWFKVEWEKPINKKQNYVVVFNHTSHLDIILMLPILYPMFVRFVGKAELSKIPLFGKFFRSIDISVKREDADDAQRAFRQADAALNSGNTVAIAPEGGTSKNPPHLRTFKSGAFRLAINHQVPILVVTFFDNWKIMPSNGQPKGPHWGRIKVHAPIETKGMTLDDFEHLSKQVSNLIQSDLEGVYPNEMKR